LPLWAGERGWKLLTVLLIGSPTDKAELQAQHTLYVSCTNISMPLEEDPP
jgi:hypothetical protein